MKIFYERDNSMVSRNIGGEMILVPIRQNVGDLSYMYTLNDVASRIWELLDESRTVSDIVSVLTQEYGVDSNEVEADVNEFLTQMKEIGAIVERPEGA